MRIERLCREYGITPHWTVFPLHPETPEEGRELTDLFPGIDLAAVNDRLQAAAAEVGLPLAPRSRTCNSRRAQELGKWAEEQGRGPGYRDAVYRAYFVAGRNIARSEELVAICEELGLDGQEARRVLEERRFAAAVDGDWARAGQRGVTAVPTVLHAGRTLVGFQPYDAYRRLVTTG